MTSIEDSFKSSQFICDYCGVSFKGKGYLQRHIDKQHRKFRCDVCENVYSQKANLFEHLRSHFERFICQYCGQEICRFEQFQKHVYLKHEPDNKKLILSFQSKESYSCRFCVRTFISAVHRNSHEKIVHKGRSEAAFQCKECNLIFITKEDLRFHSFEHYAGTLHFCAFQDCDRFFKSAKQLQHHVKIHAPAKYECEQCEKTFCQNSNFAKHKKRCKGQPNATTSAVSKEELERICRIAREQFISLGGKPRKIKHDGGVEKSKKTTTKVSRMTTEEVECLDEYLPDLQDLNAQTRKTQIRERSKRKIIAKKVIGYDSDQLKLEDLTVKIGTTTNETSKKPKRFKSSTSRSAENFICDVCAFQTNATLLLDEHLLSHKRSSESAKESPVSFKSSTDVTSKYGVSMSCDICGKTTTKPFKMKLHMKQHIKPCDKCDICHQNFRHVAKHMREVHTNERLFECQICQVGFKVNANLKNHMKIHEEPSECPICLKVLPNMERHLNWHKREKPKSHKCPQCGKQCSTKQAMHEHVQRIHEKIPLGKLYTCELCQLNFIRNRDLRRHSYIHYAGKIFSCTYPDCNEMFKQSSKLQSHMMVHNTTNEASFACCFCDKKYLRKTALHKHQKQAHSDITKQFSFAIHHFESSPIKAEQSCG